MIWDIKSSILIFIVKKGTCLCSITGHLFFCITFWTQVIFDMRYGMGINVWWVY